MKTFSDKLASLRKDYIAHVLDVDHVSESPFEQFKTWFDEALETIEHEVNVMTLASASVDGIPSARIVLLKGFNENGLSFFTNYESRKGQELIENPYASLVFYWYELERQIRIEGKVEKLSPEESTAYFQSRPKGSQIGAHASPQSQVIENRTVLEQNVERLNVRFENDDMLPRPEHWGGFRLIPNQFEFWQGRPSRLHDRIRYRQLENGKWVIERLAP
ncbi:MAG: pyridoxamine 5'-phosphate oxidase [Bacteroidota bacterium]